MRKPSACQGFRQHFRIGDNLFRVVAELGLHRLLKADRLSRDDVHQRPTLHPGKNYFVDRRGEFQLSKESSLLAARAVFYA